MQGVSGKDAISCSSRGRSFCNIKVVSGVTGLFQENVINVLRELSDASEPSGQSSESDVTATQLQSLSHSEIYIIAKTGISHYYYYYK